MLQTLQRGRQAGSDRRRSGQRSQRAAATVDGDLLARELPITVGATTEPLARHHAARTAPTRGLWQKTGRALSTFATMLVVAIAGLVMLIAFTTRVSAKQQLNVLGHPLLVVLSGSMGPAIDTGDLIIDKPVSGKAATRLRVGQTITFRDRPNSAVTLTHRIHSVVSQGGKVFYETKGDANDAPDPSLRPASDVIGTYVQKIPRGGYFLTNLHKPIVFGLFLLSPILWFIGEPLRRMARELTDEPTQDPSDSDGTKEGTP